MALLVIFLCTNSSAVIFVTFQKIQNLTIKHEELFIRDNGAYNRNKWLAN